MKPLVAALVFSCVIGLVSLRRGAAQAPSAAVDTDGDGIPDADEVNGFEAVFPDGTRERITSSPLHKDVFVFIAWMKTADHSHQPIANTAKKADGSGPIENQALGRAVDALANAPVHNPDGHDGIALHVIQVAQPAIPEVQFIGNKTPQGDYIWDDFNGIKMNVFPALPAEVTPAFHFCLFAHQLGGNGLDQTSGISKGMPSDDFIVSLGAGQGQIGTADDQMGTFLHELGHNLGLHHGGVDDVNHKPNYPSAMNYLFQFTGATRDGQEGVFDYSRISVDLDEKALNDAKGITTDPAAARFGSSRLCSDDVNGPVDLIGSFNDPVRWEDCEDGSPAADRVLQFDVNRDGQVERLKGQNDWEGCGNCPLFGTHSGTVSGNVTGAPVKPSSEAPAIAGQVQTLAITPSIRAVPSTGSVQLTWSQIPLQRVQGYQVLRKTGNGGWSPLVITKKTTFTDTSAPRGAALSYEVRTIVSVQTAPQTTGAGMATMPGAALFGGSGQPRVAYGRFSNAATVTAN